MLTDRDKLVYEQLASDELWIFEVTDEVGDNDWLAALPEVRGRLIDLGLMEKTPQSYGRGCWRRTERGERIYNFHKTTKKVLDI